MQRLLGDTAKKLWEIRHQTSQKLVNCEMEGASSAGSNRNLAQDVSRSVSSEAHAMEPTRETTHFDDDEMDLLSFLSHLSSSSSASELFSSEPSPFQVFWPPGLLHCCLHYWSWCFFAWTWNLRWYWLYQVLSSRRSAIIQVWFLRVFQKNQNITSF